uniref:C2 domain-containing protein n=1 Tax=Odontella aurita TaxID=265563 RepID=A0A7S4HT32_9STRA|mmetsp:Transcript_1471/g.4100  ORF Transcript_1471/g.4100 Transcript_1471/m.4100 type:complete len:276 (+) Transcript_1471:378-1205(+)
MTQEEKWRQPLLRDGNPVPVASYSKRSEAIIDFSISCRELLDNSVEDVKCFCVAYCSKGSPSNLLNAGTKQSDVGKGGSPVIPDGSLEIGRTEVVYNSANPDFSTVFNAKMSTYFDNIHDIIIAVYSEEDIMSDDLVKQRYLGCTRFRLESVLRKIGCNESLPLETGGFVTMSAKPSNVDSDYVVFCYSGKGLKKTSKNPIKAKKKVPKNPYIVLSYMSQKYSKWRVLWKSEVARRNETENFGVGQFQALRVNGADEDSLIQVLGMDWDEKVRVA